MLTLKLLTVSALVSTALCQSPLITLNAGGNDGNNGGAMYFNLQVTSTITITQIDFRCGPSTTAGSGVLDVFLGPTTYENNTTNLALWALVASATANVAPNALVTGTLAQPFCLGPGTYGVALRASATFDHGYTNGTGTTVPGSGNGTFSTAEVSLLAGAAGNVFMSGATFAQRIWNGQIHYTLGGTPIAVAAWQPYGQGCYAWFNSFYEFMPGTSTLMDLGNTTGGTNSLQLVFIGTGYSVGPFNTTGTFFTPTSTPLTMINNGVTTVTTPFAVPYPMPAGVQNTTSLEINDNGCVTPSGTNGGIAPVGTTQVQMFLTGRPRWCNWHDFDPTGVSTPLPVGGGIYFDVDPSGQQCYVTWQMLPDSAIVASQFSTFQLAFSSNGNVEFRWKTMSLSGGGSWPTLVGWTPGTNPVDPGSMDISASPSFTTGPNDNPPLTLAMNSRPRLGTVPLFQSTNIPTGTGIGAAIFSFGQINPGTSLAPFGMPGCRQYVDLNLGITSVFVVSGSSANTPFNIPNLPQFNGTLVFAQSVTFTPGYNPLGAIASNGVRMLVGSL